MNLIGDILGQIIFFYGGAFWRRLFVYKMKKDFKSICDEEKKENERVGKIIFFIEIIIIALIIYIL